MMMIFVMKVNMINLSMMILITMIWRWSWWYDDNNDGDDNKDDGDDFRGAVNMSYKDYEFYWQQRSAFHD